MSARKVEIPLDLLIELFEWSEDHDGIGQDNRRRIAKTLRTECPEFAAWELSRDATWAEEDKQQREAALALTKTPGRTYYTRGDDWETWVPIHVVAWAGMESNPGLMVVRATDDCDADQLPTYVKDRTWHMHHSNIKTEPGEKP